MENKNNTINIPTAVIVLTFIFFWPIGIILLILKYSTKNSIEGQAYRNLNVAQNNIANTTNLNVLKVKKTSARVGSIIAFVFGALFFIVVCDRIFWDGKLTDTNDIDISTNISINRNAKSVNTNKNSNTNTEIIAQNKKNEQMEKEKYTFVAVGGVLAILCFLLGISKWIKSVVIGNKIQKIEIYQNLILIREIYDVDEIAQYFKTSKIRVLDNVCDMIREGYLCGIRVVQNQIEKIPEYVDPNRVFNVKCPNCGANNKYTKGIENKCEYCGTFLNFNNSINQ